LKWRGGERLSGLTNPSGGDLEERGTKKTQKKKQQQRLKEEKGQKHVYESTREGSRAATERKSKKIEGIYGREKKKKEILRKSLYRDRRRGRWLYGEADS